MLKKEIDQSLKVVVDTIRNPSGLATGDAIASVIEQLVQEDSDIQSEEVIAMLQNSGFHSADGLKDYIHTQLELYKRKYING